MGSLMAGWDSPVPDPKNVTLSRNKSSTLDEIEAFWKSKKKNEEEHLRDISIMSPRGRENMLEEAKQFLDTESETSLEKLIWKNGWWISSNWAFLNEPPVIASDGATNKYTPQFHVADLAGSAKPSTRAGVSA